jgi:alpha-glucosidase (family GH31 glycosyl hydrolase)
MDEELYIRWLQFSMFGPITSVFSQPENQTSNMAWNYSDRADKLFREYAHLRMQLFPYLYSYAHKSRLQGKNMFRKFDDHNYQYMLGNEFLVAPVYEQGATSRDVDFPDGTWINYWTGEQIEGGTSLNQDAPIDRIPLFVKQGAIIPMRNYASSIEAGNNDVLTLHIYPGADSHFNLIEDDGLSNAYLEGIYAQTDIKLSEEENACSLVINPTKGSFDGMSKTRTWKLVIHTDKKVASVSVNSLDSEFTDVNGKVEVKGFSSVKSKKNEIHIHFGG